jgi:sugar O-acyltransferase (sialic acid O-acetyltransferase NeuD family)
MGGPSIPVAIYGAGGFAREAAWLIEDCNEAGQKGRRVVCFIDDNEANRGKVLNGIEVIGLEEAHRRFPDAVVIGGVGNPQVRQRLMEKAGAMGFGFETVIHPRVERSRWVTFGIGTVVCAGVILTTIIIVGDHVQINLDCTIGHDAVMGDFASLAPGVHVSGCVHLGARAYVGTGAVIINGALDAPLVVGDDAVIGAGACVTRSVPAGVTVVGVPAKAMNGSQRHPG